MKTRPQRLRFLFLVLVSFPGAVAGRADAAGISIVNVSSTGASTSTLAVGDMLTVDLVASNDTNRDIYGMELLAFGYDVNRNGVADDGLRMVDVSSIESIFNSVVVPGVGTFGGLENVEASSSRPEGDSSSPNEPALGLQTYLFRGISLSPAIGNGSLDVGLGGNLIQDGDIHFRISFQATSLLDASTIDLTFGISNPLGSPTIFSHEPGYVPSPRDDVIVSIVDGHVVFLPFENATLRVAILSDPDFVPGSGGGDGGTGGTGGSGGTGGTGGTGGDTGGGSTGGNGGPVAAVPEPGAALLFGLGLLTARLAGRR